MRKGDFYDTFSPLLVAYAEAIDKTIMTFDVSSAFLKFIRRILRRTKKDSPFTEIVIWPETTSYQLEKTLFEFLKKKGLKQLISDRSVFTNKDNSLILVIDVGDGLLIENNPHIMEMNNYIK